MISVILIVGVPVFVGFAILGIVELIKKIKQNYKINKAIEELGNQDPLDVLFGNENLYQKMERQHFQEVLVKEEVEYNQLGFFGKINNFFFAEQYVAI